MSSLNQIFIFTSLSILTGIFIQNISHQVTASMIWFLIVWVFGVLYIGVQKKYIGCILGVLFGLFLGIMIAHYNQENIETKSNVIHSYIDQKKVLFVLSIKDVYKVEDFSTQYRAKVIKINGHKVDKNILSLINVPNNFVLKKGQLISSQTKIYPFHNTRDFLYKNFMQSKNIYFKLYVSRFETIGIEELSYITKKIEFLRRSMLESIFNMYPKKEAIFLGGILIGARENLPQELKNNFNNSGLTHFIAVSGFNITILIIFLSFVVQYFPRIIKIGVVTFAIILFTLFVGESAPVVRASIMGLIGYYVLSAGRQGHALSIILLTALIMVVLNPYSINYDVSLHLSFFAVIGIIYTQSFFSRVFRFLPNILEVRTAFVLTLAALSFTLPIMIFNFGQVSIMAPIANIAVTWTIPIAMLFGFLSLLVSLVSQVLGVWLGYLTRVFLRWDMLMVDFFGTLKWSVLPVDFGVYKYNIQILYFALLTFLVLWYGKKRGPKSLSH